MFKFDNKETRTTLEVLTLSLTLRILVPLLLTFNIFHILHDLNQNTSFILEKRKKSNKFKILQIKAFFLPNTSPPSPPSYISTPNKAPSNLSFVRVYAQGVLTEFYGMLSGIKPHIWWKARMYVVVSTLLNLTISD